MQNYLAYESSLISRFAWSLVTGQGSYQIHQQGNETRIYNISSDAQHQGTQRGQLCGVLISSIIIIDIMYIIYSR